VSNISVALIDSSPLRQFDRKPREGLKWGLSTHRSSLGVMAQCAESRHSPACPKPLQSAKADIRTHSSARTIVHDALLKGMQRPMDVWSEHRLLSPILPILLLFGTIVIKWIMKFIFGRASIH
jgi:hypothetical protein